MMKKEQYIALSKLFLYPKGDYQEDVATCLLLLEEQYPEIAPGFHRFSDFIAGSTPYEIEEIFGITFHIQAICYLDIGYVLFGEDYSRGEFLLNMKKEQANINHDCEPELADNLPHVLQLLSISTDQELVEELAVKVVIPAVEKMLEEFGNERLRLRKKINKRKQKVVIMEDVVNGNIYQNAIQALLRVLKQDFEGVDFEAHKIEASTKGFEAAACGSCSFINNKTINTVRT
ncbi:MAG: hypothetical protein HN728_11975 [Flavobacteriales bacterium]|jgi:nitrate reductase assembly molybdenum cofactor insertion protein NarJ|nr:hypothetical protein [Flavobacteriales bacterium]MBT4705936.1 hypothetical protein [Flavobacteriales bacterium]MBT6132448.1 hypothetical protein [Flavobacteriales bacterium]MBT6383482.1 hypothetical protein [Flavobacteriales bacterium]MBT6917601.1 hypothetical protein [Flavobacteriales bacterium]